MMHGKNIIGNELLASNPLTFKAFNPKDNTELPEVFHSATIDELDKAIGKAAKAYAVYKQVSAASRANFLRAIADNIELLGTSLIARTMLETGLPEGRLTGERNRTVNQLRMFATLLDDGSWCDAIIDTAMPDRKPAARPDIRNMLRPVGPVVVFAASNFPLAFSTAGGDTASALAAGCTVVVKAHKYHPGTSEMVATAIVDAANKTGMPEGVFSCIHTIEHSVGQALVLHPLVKSVGFTGSYTGGKTLYNLAQKREEPIPVFAEMGSVNPVLLLPDKLSKSAIAVAAQIAGSVALGAGQFCTNPGLIVALADSHTDAFVHALTESIQAQQPETMLNPGIKTAFANRLNEVTSVKEVTLIAQSANADVAVEGRPTVAKVNAKAFLANTNLAEEVFGPFSLVIECATVGEMQQVIGAFKGQLTASVMCTETDIANFSSQIFDLQEVVGRIVFNGVPTGVEVCHAMQHGGPYPASTDGRFTSVGTAAIRRFVRPVSFQDAPDMYLPDALKNSNPLNIWRLVNGQFTKNAIA